MFIISLMRSIRWA